MLQRYSIVFHPSPEVIETVQNMKSNLAASIGWFSSRNSLAHITIQEFLLDDSKLLTTSKQLQRCCNSLHPVQVEFDSFDSFPNGAFYLKPNLVSAQKLSTMMKQIQRSVPVPNTHRGLHPHLTIARRLQPENTAVAQLLFTSIHLKYTCNQIALRRFDEVKKQFEITAIFPFLSQPSTVETQGSLF